MDLRIERITGKLPYIKAQKAIQKVENEILDKNKKKYTRGYALLSSHRRKDGLMDGWMHACMRGWMDGRRGGKEDGREEGRKGGRQEVFLNQ